MYDASHWIIISIPGKQDKTDIDQQGGEHQTGWQIPVQGPVRVKYKEFVGL